MLDLGFSGIEDALKNLARVTAPVNDRTIGKNAAVALQPIADRAKQLVPRDSGDLAGAITIAVEYSDNTSGGVTAYVGPLSAGVQPGSNHVFYAHFVEYGTVNMRAQPFMAPAVHEYRELVFDVLGQKVGQDMVGAL